MCSYLSFFKFRFFSLKSFRLGRVKVNSSSCSLASLKAGIICNCPGIWTCYQLNNGCKLVSCVVSIPHRASSDVTQGIKYFIFMRLPFLIFISWIFYLLPTELKKKTSYEVCLGAELVLILTLKSCRFSQVVWYFCDSRKTRWK